MLTKVGFKKFRDDWQDRVGGNVSLIDNTAKWIWPGVYDDPLCPFVPRTATTDTISKEDFEKLTSKSLNDSPITRVHRFDNVLIVDIPGIDPDKIEPVIKNNIFYINVSGKDYYIFALNTMPNIDVDNIDANIKNGRLTITFHPIKEKVSKIVVKRD